MFSLNADVYVVCSLKDFSHRGYHNFPGILDIKQKYKRNQLIVA